MNVEDAVRACLDGKKVRRQCWRPERLFVSWDGESFWYSTPARKVEDWPGANDYELYEPEPAEPERVRWPLEWRPKGDLECQDLRAIVGSDEHWVAECLPFQTIDGYRFYAWVYKLPDGRERLYPARYLPLYWSPSAPCVFEKPGMREDD